jgi:predicted GNAT family N-acyltransferase
MTNPVPPGAEIILVVPVYSQLANLAFALRREVFMREQGVSHADEYDDKDKDATHVVTVQEGEVVATLRILWLPEHAKIGRFAVRQSLRNQGVGSRLFAATLELIRQNGGEHIGLEAQVDRIAFYERFGFHAYGEEYLDAGILHRRMKNY